MWTDNNLWKCSWADAVISVKGSHLFLMNCCPRARRSPTSNIYFKPRAFYTEISLDSFLYVTITQVLKDTIMLVIFVAVTTNITVSFRTSQNPSSVQAAGVHLRSRHVCHRISRGIFTCRRDAPLLDFVNETDSHALGTDLANGRWKHFSHTSKWKTQQPMRERQVLPVLHNLAEVLHVWALRCTVWKDGAERQTAEVEKTKIARSVPEMLETIVTSHTNRCQQPEEENRSEFHEKTTTNINSIYFKHLWADLVGFFSTHLFIWRDK